jgi:hypothetical protein
LKKLLIKCLLCIIPFSVFGAEIQEKPFILKHLYHHHEFNIVNGTVYQQISSYGAFYNSTNLFFTYGITAVDEIFFNGSVVLGNGIVKHAENLGYSISPTGADMQNDVENINGTGRKHILELWYHRTLGKLDIVLGLIDSTAFVDENDYANDQNIQFLNSAFTNNPVAPLPSYNPGVYIRYSKGNTEYKLVIIDNEPEDGTSTIFQFNTNINGLNLRPYIYNVFGSDETNNGFGFSGDYTKGKLGFFVRVGIPFEKQNSFFSFGIEKRKVWFGKDKIGIGFGIINKEKNAYISEFYYTKNLMKHVSITGDIQYMKEFRDDIILGGRLYLSY